MRNLEILLLCLTFALCSCQDDDSTKNDYELNGNWTIQAITVEAQPINGANITKAALLDSLGTDFTFFNQGSSIVFDDDSVAFSAIVNGNTMTMILPYVYNPDRAEDQELRIDVPDSLSFEIYGDVDFETQNVMSFEISDESYYLLLLYFGPSYLNQILSADVTYYLTR